jgi:hypothetical protein
MSSGKGRSKGRVPRTLWYLELLIDARMTLEKLFSTCEAGNCRLPRAWAGLEWIA